jgi:diacylglycerol kinase family enzyme
MIPIGASMVGDAFGVTLENACKTLAARRIVNLDLGRIDNKYFFVCRALVKAADPELSLDGTLTVTAQGRVSVEIVNIIGDQYGYRGARPQPDDGRLNVYILKTEGGLMRKEISQSAFVCRQIHVVRGALQVELDGGLEISGIKDIEISSKALTAIVGRERMF